MTNEEITEYGHRLFQSAENLRQSAVDLDALMDCLWEAAKDKRYFGDIEDSGDENTEAGGIWVKPAYAYNAAVKSYPERAPGQRGRNKRPKHVGTLTFILRLCNTGDFSEIGADWPWLDQACLILGWHSQIHPYPEDSWGIEHFDPEDDHLAAIQHQGHGLWAWQEDDQCYANFFAIPIFALRNEEDVKKFALGPLKTLFYSPDPVAAAKEAFRDVPVLTPLSANPAQPSLPG